MKCIKEEWGKYIYVVIFLKIETREIVYKFQSRLHTSAPDLRSQAPSASLPLSNRSSLQCNITEHSIQTGLKKSTQRKNTRKKIFIILSRRWENAIHSFSRQKQVPCISKDGEDRPWVVQSRQAASS